MNEIRARIAPSPTGFLHIGTARTALFNWLFARKHGGTFVLRVEDTDTKRSTQEFDRAIWEGLAWLGIDWDEGPDFGGVPKKGDYGPYRQSQRRDLHLQEANRLLDSGWAYKCFHTPDELQAFRERNALIRNEGKWRNAPEEEVSRMGDAPYAIRFKVPEGVTEIDDLVQGRVRIENKEIDDFVIVKPNGDPIFHLAVVVDDGLMKITHVIRGDDHLSNTPRHVMLFKALGYGVPTFAHLPMVLTENGKKLSKRDHGSNLLDWRAEGYLPETLVNYVAFLGWNPGDERELFSREELIEAFDLSRVSQAGARFDMKRIQYLNGQHIRRLSPEDLCDRITPVLQEAGFDLSGRSREWMIRLTLICREKLRTLNDIVAQTEYFFVEPAEYEAKAVKKQWEQEDALDRMGLIRSMLEGVERFSHEAMHAAYQAKAEETGAGLGKLIHPTRLALTGKSVGPGLFELAELLGREVCLNRIDKAISYIERMSH